ncbi:SPASM domain-containing protein, partial [Candidatus Fermentibacterales bacterium]|nr:SPASM domain-containing protein [Candidatus Fermentibacterales bacterium]
RTGVMSVFGDGVLEEGRIRGAKGGRKRFCFVGTGLLHLEPDGRVYPCSSLLDAALELGRVEPASVTESLMEIWMHSGVLAAVRKLTVENLASCRDCDISSLCAGGCRSAAYWATGSLSGDYPYCWLHRELWRNRESLACKP